MVLAKPFEQHPPVPCSRAVEDDGGVFAAEAISVILQTSVYKWYKRTRGREYADSHRVFRMAPLHHHFEKLGWAETTVVTRFYILGLFCALVALSTLKVR